MFEYFACIPICQKKASDPITDGCESPYGCWDLNSGPQEEQPVLLTIEPSLQPIECILTLLSTRLFPNWSQRSLCLWGVSILPVALVVADAVGNGWVEKDATAWSLGSW